MSPRQDNNEAYAKAMESLLSKADRNASARALNDINEIIEINEINEIDNTTLDIMQEIIEEYGQDRTQMNTDLIDDYIRERLFTVMQEFIAFVESSNP